MRFRFGYQACAHIPLLVQGCPHFDYPKSLPGLHHIDGMQVSAFLNTGQLQGGQESVQVHRAMALHCAAAICFVVSVKVDF